MNFLKFIEARHKDPKQKVFTLAHQSNGMRRFLESLDAVKHEIKKLTSQIAIKGFGPFSAWQILCDLLEGRILGDNSNNQWTSLGPGAKNWLTQENLPTSKGELKHTRLIRDLCATSGPKFGFEALGISFPAFLDKELSLKNIDHALCEYDNQIFAEKIRRRPAVCHVCCRRR